MITISHTYMYLLLSSPNLLQEEKQNFFLIVYKKINYSILYKILNVIKIFKITMIESLFLFNYSILFI